MNKEIKMVDNHKHLGITLSKDLTWSDHIDNLIKGAAKQLNIMKLFKYKLSRECLDTIYCSFIRPKLEYGSVLFAGAPKYQLAKLFKFELEALKVVTGATHGTSKAKIYIEFGKASLFKRLNSNVLSFFYKIHNGMAPNYLTTILDSFKHHNLCNIRANMAYKLPMCKLSVFARSFFPVAINLWNSLPMEQRQLESLNCFKRILIPKSSKHKIYSQGAREVNIQHARLRMGCSLLNDDLCSNLHVIVDKSCACG
jgi:hypothetical protein